jgi:CBS domain-containing membrane protein
MKILVRDLMTSKVFTLRADENLTALYDLMEAEHIRHIPVVDEQGDVVGLVTHRDLLRSALADPSLPVSIQRQVLETATVEEIMMTSVETIEPDQDIREAAEIMMENKFGCLPVVENGHLVGILTEADFVRHLARIAPMQEARSGPRPPVVLRHR